VSPLPILAVVVATDQRDATDADWSDSNYKIVNKLDGVPAIHDSVTYAQYVLSP
jgi:hypothetical protein